MKGRLFLIEEDLSAGVDWVLFDRWRAWWAVYG